MAKITRFKSTAAETEGVWVDAGAGLRLKIARANNANFDKVLSRLTRPHLQRIRNGSFPDEDMKKLVWQATAETILLDWENLEDEEGNEVPYSPEKALELLTEYKDFRDMVSSYAQDATLFKQELDEEAKGN